MRGRSGGPGDPWRSGRSHPGRAALWPVLPWLLALAACAGPGGLDAGFDVEELPSPAGSGSGEPNLAVDGDGVLMSWLEPAGGERWSLRMARLARDGWEGARTVATDSSFFVNWADFPSVVPVGDGVLAAHWLQRGSQGGYDYGVRVALSLDGGTSWNEPWIPHRDRTATEHGFVSFVPAGDGRTGVIWLDGRDYAHHGESSGSQAHEHPEGPEMSLRFRTFAPGGEPGGETLLDGRVCDCCQTDAVHTAEGPLVVYRNRSAGEVRDIHVVRMRDGSWTEPRPVHEDGWVFPACPVNGPAVAARVRRVAVAWFTGADDVPRVRLAFSDDAGATFADPIEVDDGNPAGRVDVVLLGDGSAVVSWLERRDGSAELRLRRLVPGGGGGATATVATSTDGRSSGFPRMALTPGGTLVLAWTDDTNEASRVRVARARVRRGGESGGAGS